MSTSREERRDSSARRPLFYRVLRAAFPLHLLFLVLLVLACLVPLSEEDYSCTLSNNFARSFYPMLRYTNGPPPTWKLPRHPSGEVQPLELEDWKTRGWNLRLKAKQRCPSCLTLRVWLHFIGVFKTVFIVCGAPRLYKKKKREAILVVCF